MKEFLLLIMSVFLLICLVGCFNADIQMQDGTDAETNGTVESTATSPTTAEPPTAIQQPMVAISLPTLSETTIADDGTEVFHHTYQNISLVVPEQEVADKIIIDFLNRTDTAKDAEDIGNSALTSYGDGMLRTPYWLQVTHKPVRIDRGIISLFGTYASYNGAAHSGQIYSAVTYDVTTGNALTLDDILTDTVTADTVCRLVLDSLAEQKASKSLFEEYETTVKEMFTEHFLSNEAWYLSEQGLHFFFSPYEIGPYSSGDIHATIHYEKLTGILEDAYFPPEQQEVNGSVTAQVFTTDASSQYTQICELTLDTDATKILVSTDNAIRDLHIYTGTWNSAATAFTVQQTVFAAAGLSTADAVIIEAEFGEELPTIAISYRTADKTIVKYLTFESDTGTVTLTEQ